MFLLDAENDCIETDYFRRFGDFEEDDQPFPPWTRFDRKSFPNREISADGSEDRGLQERESCPVRCSGEYVLNRSPPWRCSSRVWWERAQEHGC